MDAIALCLDFIGRVRNTERCRGRQKLGQRHVPPFTKHRSKFKEIVDLYPVTSKIEHVSLKSISSRKPEDGKIRGRVTALKNPSLPMRGWQIALKILTWIVCLFSLSVMCALFLLIKFGRDLPDYYKLKDYHPPVITHLYNRMGEPLFEFATERRVYVHLSDLPSKLTRAFLSAEDKNFYKHGGIDLKSLVKALALNTLQNRWSTHPVGGSTITQQIAKILLVGNYRSLSRKIKEAILAFRLEKALSKDKILELYLNQIYLGSGAYGVASASEVYFHKAPSELTLAECAFLASLPKSPGSNTSLKTYKKLLDRRNWVLQQMKKNGVITKEELQAAKQELIPVHNVLSVELERYPTYVIEEARRELIRRYGEKATYSAGIEATLTIHPKLQRFADGALQYALELYDRRQGWRGPFAHVEHESEWEGTLKRADALDLPCRPAVIVETVGGGLKARLVNGKEIRLGIDNFLNEGVRKKLRRGDCVYVKQGKEGTWGLSQIPKVTGGIAVLDAKSGEILALSGGYAYSQNQFNGATQAYRQPGSAFKPFVYLAALEAGFKPDSVLVEKPVAIPTAGGIYRPHNYNKGVYGGPMTLTEALVKSRNVFTVILAQHIGLKRMTDIAKQCGVSEYLPLKYPIALGAGETTVMRLAGAYASFFNGGLAVEPTLFLNITSPLMDCKWTVPRSSTLPFKRKSLTQLKKMLAACVERGTGKELRSLMDKYPVRIYGKTGTSNSFKDTWFVGCIEAKPDAECDLDVFKKRIPLIVAVFIGYPFPSSLGNHETGAKVALPAAYRLMDQLCSSSHFDVEGKISRTKESMH